LEKEHESRAAGWLRARTPRARGRRAIACSQIFLQYPRETFLSHQNESNGSCRETDASRRRFATRSACSAPLLQKLFLAEQEKKRGHGAMPFDHPPLLHSPKTKRNQNKRKRKEKKKKKKNTGARRLKHIQSRPRAAPEVVVIGWTKTRYHT
jgi:hypothetical protein